MTESKSIGLPEQLIHLHNLFVKQAQELRTEAQP